MKTYDIHRSGAACPITITGDGVVDAVEKNFDSVRRCAGQIGNAAGYLLYSVRLSYHPGILGGQGGIVVQIQHSGLDLANRPASPEVKTSVAWIYATKEDLPEPVEIGITR